ALASCSHGAPVRAIRRTGFRAPRRRGSPLFPYTTLFRSLNVMYLIARDYRDTRPMSFDRLAEQLRIPAIALTPVVNSLESAGLRSEEHTSELQSRENLVCRPLLEKQKHSAWRAVRRGRAR